MERLTVKEKEVYSYIVKFLEVNGFAPNITEISMACYTSRSFAREVIYKLEEKGMIVYGGTYRSIRLTQRSPFNVL